MRSLLVLALLSSLAGCLPAPECIRAVQCVEHCGGPVVENAGCGTCSAGHIDIASCPTDAGLDASLDGSVDAGADVGPIDDASTDTGASPDTMCAPVGGACDATRCCSGVCCLTRFDSGVAAMICQSGATCM